MSLTASAKLALVGRRLTFTATVENAGPYFAIKLRLTNWLPGKVRLVSTSGGSCSGEKPVVCVRPSLAREQRVRFTFVTRAVEQGTITDRTSIDASGSDPTPDNDQSHVESAIRVPRRISGSA